MEAFRVEKKGLSPHNVITDKVDYLIVVVGDRPINIPPLLRAQSVAPNVSRRAHMANPYRLGES